MVKAKEHSLWTKTGMGLRLSYINMLYLILGKLLPL